MWPLIWITHQWHINRNLYDTLNSSISCQPQVCHLRIQTQNKFYRINFICNLVPSDETLILDPCGRLHIYALVNWKLSWHFSNDHTQEKCDSSNYFLKSKEPRAFPQRLTFEAKFLYYKYKNLKIYAVREVFKVS